MDINKLTDNIDLESQIELDDIPELDLYMDQVIQLFESKLKKVKRDDEEKILTKTMINNYAKGKLLLPIKNKKYSKEHLILMAFIYNFKGVLSINDIKLSLDKIIESCEEDRQYPLRELYGYFLEDSKEDVKEVTTMIQKNAEKISRKIDESTELEGDFEKKFLLLSSLINMSNMYRRISEKMIDEFFKEL